MKGNFIKYIFIIFVIAIIIAVIYKENEEKIPENEETTTSSYVDDEIVKEITLGVAEFDTMNPILSQNKQIQEISRIIYEPLLELDEQYKLKKCLAKDWAKTGETTYLVKIRDDVIWSDGTKFSVEDVIFTIETLKQIQSIYTNNVQNITNVEKIDEDTIQITVDREIPFFEYNLIFPIMSKTFYEGQDFANSEKNNAPIGTGKYKIVENVSNAVVLNKNENYSREELTLEKITIGKYANMGEFYNAFKLGKIDIITTNNIVIDDYIGTIGYNKQETQGREFDFLAFNTQNTVLTNIEVRKAISHAINRENIVIALYNNKYQVTDYPLDYGSWLKGEKGDMLYNPDLAKQVLEEKGWEFKNNKWQKIENYNTKTLSFKIVVQASNQNRVAVAEMIKNDLETIGINVSVVKASDSQYQSYLQNKNYDAIITGTTRGLSPNLELYFDSANFYNEELNNLLSEIKNITKEDLLEEKYIKIRQIYNEQIPYIGLYSSYYSIMSSWAFMGNINPSWYNIFIDINNWYKN